MCGTVHAILFNPARGTVNIALFISTSALFIHRRFSAPCGHHAGRHRGCCPPCSAQGYRQGGRGRRGAGHRCASPRPGLPPPPQGRVQGHRLGADGYCCPSPRAIFVFIVVFPGRGLVARPHRLFDLRRHGRHRISPSGSCSAQRPPAGEHCPQLLHQLR
jgi:hypothetical protein